MPLMTNAEAFLYDFGIYATELWAMPEAQFLEWLNAWCDRERPNKFPAPQCMACRHFKNILTEEKTMNEYIVRETDCDLATKHEIVGELVRCRDCKHYWRNHADDISVSVCLASPEDDAFCSEGERKE